MLGKYEIHNWVTDGSGTYRLIVNSFKNDYGCLYKRIRKILIYNPCYDLACGDWAIIFEGNIFEKEYFQLGFEEITFHSLNEAKQNIDKFFDKLMKLKMFL